MATPKKETPLQSPLVTALNNIVNVTRSKSQIKSTQRSYNEFLRFMTTEVKNLESIKLPDEKKVKKLANINVSATFGSAGSLLASLASGALDAAGLVGDLFGGRKGGKGGKPKAKPKAGKPIPKGRRIRLPGVRGLPILSAALAGLDFAEGISQGESTGKAAAGAGGAAVGAAAGGLAGVALAGTIGQALVPIPGLGFVLGAAVGTLGSFAGGYLADRAYEKATGEGSVKEKTKTKLKQQEQKQKATAAAKTTATLPQVLDKFDSVVTQFEKSIINLNLAETITTPIGYDEELTGEDVPDLPEGTPDGGAESIKYGTGNAEFGETGNVSNAPNWVHGHFQSDSAAAVTKDTTMVVKALLQQGSPVYLNPGVDLDPKKKYTDEQLRSYVEAARKAHTHSGTGKSIDVFVKKGTKVPVPLTDVGPTGSGFGGYGRGGIAGYIQGTRTWIGHLKPGSKGGLSQEKGEIKSKGKETGEMEGLKPQPQTQGPPQATAVSQTKPIPTSTSKPSPDTVAKFEQAWQYRNNPFARGRIEDAWKNMSTEQKQQAVSWAESKGYDWKEMKLSAPVVPKQIQAVSQQPTTPKQIEQYPDYNLPQSSVTLMPIVMGGGGGTQQRPMVVSASGGGTTTIMPPTPEGQVLNSLFKTILLTNLSGT
jgi:hypothetical protein